MQFETIAHIYNDFNTKFGIPRQSGISDGMKSKIVFEKEYADVNSVKGLEGYSHLWLLWHFSENGKSGFSPTVRPPRLGGNTRVGVFATRSPFRPNPIGLSSVRLLEIDTSHGITLTVGGADILSGTPILDIKPYIAYTDSHPDAVCGFADRFVSYRLNVDFPEAELAKISGESRDTIIGLLENDPRPSYIDNPERIFTMSFGKYEIKFSVSDNTLLVKSVITVEASH